MIAPPATRAISKANTMKMPTRPVRRAGLSNSTVVEADNSGVTLTSFTCTVAFSITTLDPTLPSACRVASWKIARRSGGISSTLRYV